MIRCLRTTRSARSRPLSVRSASFFLPRSIRPSASSRFSISPAEARETWSISATREASGGRPGAVRRVLADRKGEEVDRLEVLVYRVAGGRHAAILPRPACKGTLTRQSSTDVDGRSSCSARSPARTIFLGLPDRADAGPRAPTRAPALSALATGILVFLLWDVHLERGRPDRLGARTRATGAGSPSSACSASSASPPG